MTESHPTSHDASSVERDEINIGVLAMTGALITVVVVLVAILLQAWFYHGKGDLSTARTVMTTAPHTALGQALVEQQEKISTYRWINREAKTVAIPIERAMKLVADELAR